MMGEGWSDYIGLVIPLTPELADEPFLRDWRNPVHLNLDGLFAGVLVAWLFHERRRRRLRRGLDGSRFFPVPLRPHPHRTDIAGGLVHVPCHASAHNGVVVIATQQQLPGFAVAVNQRQPRPSILQLKADDPLSLHRSAQ